MSQPSLKILIVDDMKTMRVLMRKRLAELGLTEVVEAQDGEEAWRELEKAIKAQQPFQLVISDWAMPQLKGIHLLKRIRSHSQMKGLAFVMLTAENEAESVKEAIQEGVTNYLVKPFTTEIFQEKVKAALRVVTSKKVA